MTSNFLQDKIVSAPTKIAMLIMDGLGGLPREPGGKTELETAFTPNMDGLAAQSELGLTVPVGPGITAGSGPGHLAIFGYDPTEYEIGRGAMEALGVDFDLCAQDVAARGNFCTIDDQGNLIDRRAGRLPTETSRELAQILRTIRVEGAKFFIEPVKEHRFAFIIRGPDLGDALTETDPLRNGVPPLRLEASQSESKKTADRVNEFLRKARKLLADCQPANMILLRGFAKFPKIPSYREFFGLNAAAIAVNGMYKGVARLAGMTVLDLAGETLRDELDALERNWDHFDFFYLHIKKTDTCGENGDFDGKVRAIEEVDAQIPRLLALKPDVVIIAGDHSTPSILKAHSWHPVPLLLYSKSARMTGIANFGERSCAQGNLGIFPARHVMPIALAHAGRIAKYGA